jgi:hypothetical protein
VYNLTRTSARTLLGATVAAVVIAACATTESPTASSESRAALAPSGHASHANGVELTPEQRAGVIAVRQATAPFQYVRVARNAGYTNQFPAGCAASAAGAQGFHFLNPSLVDDKVDLLRPELVMYEPQADGTMKLVGVDYIIPFDKWTSPDAPTLLGVPMMRNEPLGVWALHIWAQRANPSGMFAMWNPAASCAYAANAEFAR